MAEFDVFLSYNREDRKAARELADKLREYSLSIWLDEEQIVPGRSWISALEDIIQTVRAAAVLVGSGVGPWENAEMRACLSEFIDRRIPVVPVILPGVTQAPELPVFLREFTWVDLRAGLEGAAIDRLVWGITGRRPSPKAPERPRGAPEETCFVIMPFGGWFDQYYETIYEPAIKSSGLEPRRADDLYRPSSIVHDIWSLTKEAKIVLADLTDKNPNVFYELGLAHAMAKPAILVTASLSDVPFDLRALRVLEYDKNRPNWGDLLMSNIQQSISEVLASPSEAVLPTFLAK